MSELIPVITVDGPVGVGKGTTTLQLAHDLGWHLLDSGAIYRVLGYAAQQAHLALDAEHALAQLAQQLDLHFQPDYFQQQVRVYLNGVDVSDAIRREEAGTAASKVAAFPTVRETLLARQRAFRQVPGLIADGRDMGTIVFPDAALKIFLTASAEERANRRYKQLMQKGIDASIANLVTEIKHRDQRDTQRAVAPLVPAADALVLDTTDLSVTEVVARVWQAIHACPALQGHVKT